MTFVNVGVKIGDADIPTKTGLKNAIAANPAYVRVYGTSEFGYKPDTIVSLLAKGDKYTVVGPNPYTSRKWYATISWSDKLDEWVVS